MKKSPKQAKRAKKEQKQPPPGVTAHAGDGDNNATPEKLEMFIALLSEYGNVSKAAKEAKLNRPCLYRRYDEDKTFAADWDMAAKLGNKALEDEARRRAYNGTDRPVFYKGEVVGAIREYSDTLLMFLMKAYDKRFVDSQNINLNGAVATTDLDFSKMSDEEILQYVSAGKKRTQ